MIKLFTILCLMGYSYALERLPIEKVELGNVIKDINKTQTNGKETTVIMFMPGEYWKIALEKQKEKLGVMYENIVSNFNNKLVIMALDLKIGDNATFNYTDPNEIEMNLSITAVVNGKSIKINRSLNEQTNAMLTLIRPFIANSMGNLGKNICLFAYETEEIAGTKLFDVYQEGEILAQYRDKQFSLKTPLNSFFVPRKLKNGQFAHISWKYDPWTGEKLPN